MPKELTDEQVEAYRRDGFVGGIPVLSDQEVSRFRSELEAFEASNGEALDFPERSKSYLLFEFADAIVHHTAVLDAIEDVIGPDILVYHTTMNTKEAQNAAVRGTLDCRCAASARSCIRPLRSGNRYFSLTVETFGGGYSLKSQLSATPYLSARPFSRVQVVSSTKMPFARCSLRRLASISPG